MDEVGQVFGTCVELGLDKEINLEADTEIPVDFLCQIAKKLFVDNEQLFKIYNGAKGLMLDFYNFANPVDVDKGLTEEETKQLDASKRKLVLLIQQYEAGFFCEGFHCNETTFIRPTNKITGEETDKFNSVREKAKIKEFLDSSGVTDVLAVTKEEIVEALAAGIKNEEVK
jgi:hypothetical protein